MYNSSQAIPGLENPGDAAPTSSLPVGQTSGFRRQIFKSSPNLSLLDYAKPDEKGQTPADRDVYPPNVRSILTYKTAKPHFSKKDNSYIVFFHYT